MEQEDSLREEFRMTDLELVYEAENEISFELSHLCWHIPKSEENMEYFKNESLKAVANSKITAPLLHVAEQAVGKNKNFEDDLKLERNYVPVRR